MRNFGFIIVITAIFAGGPAVSAFAQKQAERTSSAQAAYGLVTVSGKHKVKKVKKVRKNKQPKARKSTQTKNARARTPLYRKKSVWAS
jgi:hypothetical protein